jgi:hypothetical protein
MYWRSKLQVFDNSGVIVVKCLQLYRQTKPKIGGLCLVVVRKKRVVRDAVKKKINFFFFNPGKEKNLPPRGKLLLPIFYAWRCFVIRR